MRILSVQEALQRKFAREARLPGLVHHASGHCVHIGQISPGCMKCFVPDTFWNNIRVGATCNARCPYCFGYQGTDVLTTENKIALLKKAVTADLSGTIPTISFSGGGETLLHLDVIAQYVEFYHGLEKHLKARPWYYLYTNGLLASLDTQLRLQELGFDEIRFHLGASDFSPQVYANMALAVRHFKAVTIETPAWPPHRQKLFEMLPIIQDMGVKHLNIGEIEITRHNRDTVVAILPDAEVYQCFGIHLDDGGLVYDLMEEVLRRGYSYSVLDCSCLVKSIQRAPGKWVIHEPAAGLCAEY